VVFFAIYHHGPQADNVTQSNPLILDMYGSLRHILHLNHKAMAVKNRFVSHHSKQDPQQTNVTVIYTEFNNAFV
jgi:hypothetical protein